MLEVVELLDGPLGAGAAGVFAEAAEAAREVLARPTIADVAEAEAPRRRRDHVLHLVGPAIAGDALSD